MLLFFLIIFPFVFAAMLWAVPFPLIRRILVWCGCAVLLAATLGLFAFYGNKDILYFTVSGGSAGRVILAGEILMCAFIVWVAARAGRWQIAALSLVQTAVAVFLESSGGHATHHLFIDKFSLIMALIIGGIGSLIVLYAAGYMDTMHRQHHGELGGLTRWFFPVLFVFLGAMFGIVFSNNLLWFYFFWEITTLCSFLLIGYKRTEESVNNAFRALMFNLWGGLAFALGLAILVKGFGIVELDTLLVAKAGGGVLLAAVLLSIAGMTKSAQLPFSSWLTGAMVAPTPVSALLHSTTMVKAGVYLLLRLAFLLQNTMGGFGIALVGSVTFTVTSLIAISQTDAKKVLAYSTIANLGLIVMCAGVGTYEAVWAGLMLIIFHAIAKCLLFLCVGDVEHTIHSRNIEDMEGLIVTMPKMSIMMQIGIAGMFLAPFGMLISKWGVLKAIVDQNPLMSVFLVFGGAATLFFWVKWLGKLLIVSGPKRETEDGISVSEWIPMATLTVLTVAVCASFPLVSSYLVEPYVKEIFGKTFAMSAGNVHIMSIMLGMVMLFPLSFFNYGKKVKVVDAYLGGGNTSASTDFKGFRGEPVAMAMRNYYLGNYWGEERLLRFGVVLCAVLLAICLGVAFV